MSSQTLWPQKEAKRIVTLAGDRKDVVLQTGFGPSGPPHIGTYGEIVRTGFVALAVRDLGYKPKIISFLDDLDGLRKVPGGFPAWLSDYLGRPVCDIPDPFDCCKSYADHMRKLLVDMIDDVGVECDFVLSSEEYRKGRFNPVIDMALRNESLLKSIIVPTLSEEVGARWFPFFVRCEQCGKLYTTRVLSADIEAQTVDYVCDGEFGEVRGCGNNGTSSYLNGGGKLPWKVDWPARWFALDVDYEIHGKDLIESVDLGKRIISKVFGKRPPLTMVYELFLDAEGKKISKSKGAAIDPTLWLRYGTRDSLHLILFRKPKQAKRLDIMKMPSYVSDAFEVAADYYAEDADARAPGERHTYEFLTLYSPAPSQPGRIDFATLCNLVAALGENQPEIIKEYAEKLRDESTKCDEALLDELVLKAIRFADELLKSQTTEALA
ncbi:lysine--tRNA ligase, partial [bacterium]|nr:lysine--tRNA ligase [bacterium]